MTLREVLNVIDGSQRISIQHDGKYVGVFKNDIALSYLNPALLTYTVMDLYTTNDADVIYIYIINRKGKKTIMTGNEYQELAARTINKGLTFEEQKFHALHGMVGEIGEIHSIYQKMYQGHAFEVDHVKKEFGDLLWFIAEYCTAKGWSLDDIMRMNIDKLKERYPDGFKAEQSLHRKACDI